MEAMQKKIADALMKAHGINSHHLDQPATWSKEFQNLYDLMFHDAGVALNTIMDSSVEEEENPEPLLGVVDPPLKKDSAVEAKGTFFISCQTPPGKPMHVKDVKQWLEILELAEIPDDEEVEGELFIAHDFPLAGVDPS